MWTQQLYLGNVLCKPEHNITLEEIKMSPFAVRKYWEKMPAEGKTVPMCISFTDLSDLELVLWCADK